MKKNPFFLYRDKVVYNKLKYPTLFYFTLPSSYNFVSKPNSKIVEFRLLNFSCHIKIRRISEKKKKILRENQCDATNVYPYE